MPQAKPYFAIKLPHNWWVFGVDNGLTNDINRTQFEYFLNVISLMDDSAKVVICSHEPDYIYEDSLSSTRAKTLNLLLKHLGTRAKVSVIVQLEQCGFYFLFILHIARGLYFMSYIQPRGAL